MYVSYSSALEMTNLTTLADRREKRCLDFAKKCIKHPKNSRMFPAKKFEKSDHLLRQREKFEVNFASSHAYQRSAIPYCQRLLNPLNGDVSDSHLNARGGENRHP